MVSEQAGYSTMVFMIGWALGGIVFGILGDRLGRAKTMMLTILSYTIFTGMSLLSTGVWDFNVYRFLCGLGVGGQFAVGVALVAEVVPERARPYALGIVQAFSAVGNMMAALTGIVLGQMQQAGVIARRLAIRIPGRRAAGAAGPDRLQEAARAGAMAEGARRKEAHGFVRRACLGNPRWRRNAIVGLLLAFSGVVGLWGIGFFSYDLFRPILERTFRAQGITGAALAGKTTTWLGVTSLFQNAGCLLRRLMPSPG